MQSGRGQIAGTGVFIGVAEPKAAGKNRKLADLTIYVLNLP